MNKYFENDDLVYIECIDSSFGYVGQCIILKDITLAQAKSIYRHLLIHDEVKSFGHIQYYIYRMTDNADYLMWSGIRNLENNPMIPFN